MSTMKTRQLDAARGLREQAAQWLLILEDGRPEDREAFSEWLTQSPLHVDAFLNASAVDSLLGKLDPKRAISIERGPFEDIEPQIAPARASDRHDAHRHERKRWPWAVAAGVGALALALGMMMFERTDVRERPDQYVTAIGEQRTIPLPDGSVLYLNTDSRVSVRFTGHERRIQLDAGEAMFKVNRDPQRPFRVITGRSVVQAIGTQFNVYRRQEDSVVAVTEGVVEVSRAASLVDQFVPAKPGSAESPVRVKAGETLSISGAGPLAAPRQTDITRVVAWRSRRLVFQDDTLAAIAEEFNRYNVRPKIEVADPSVAQRRFAAMFDADDPESLVVILQRDPSLSVEHGSDAIIVRRAP